MSLFRKKEKRTITLPYSIMQLASLYSSFNQKNSAVIFCENIIANTIATLPLKVYKTVEGFEQEEKKHYLNEIVQKIPNLNEVPSTFFNLIVKDVLQFGNAYIYVIKKRNKVSQLIRLHPNSVKVKFSGYLKFFEYDEKTYTTKEIIHIPSSLGYDGKTGKSVIEFAKDTILTSNKIQNYINSYFDNPMSRFKIDFNNSEFKEVDKDKLNEFIEFFSYIGSQINSGKPLVEFAGITIKTLDLPDNSNAELVKNREFTERQICQFYNVPYSLLTNQNLANYEMFNQFFIQNTLIQYTDKIEQYFTRALFSNVEQKIYKFKYDFSELLKTDTKTKNEIITNQLKNGIVSINEARQELNKPKLDINAANQHVIFGFGLVDDDVFNAYAAGSKLKQLEFENQVDNKAK